MQLQNSQTISSAYPNIELESEKLWNKIESAGKERNQGTSFGNLIVLQFRLSILREQNEITEIIGVLA